MTAGCECRRRQRPRCYRRCRPSRDCPTCQLTADPSLEWEAAAWTSLLSSASEGSGTPGCLPRVPRASVFITEGEMPWPCRSPPSRKRALRANDGRGGALSSVAPEAGSPTGTWRRILVASCVIGRRWGPTGGGHQGAFQGRFLTRTLRLPRMPTWPVRPPMGRAASCKLIGI